MPEKKPLIKSNIQTIIIKWAQVGSHIPVCIFCKSHLEETEHVLVSCSFSYNMWVHIYNWFGFDVVLPSDFKSHFLQHTGFLCSRVSGFCWQLVWFAIVWSIWLHRNDIIFNNCGLEFDKLYDAIRLPAWKWCANYVQDSYFSYPNWCMNPISCLEYSLKRIK